MKKHLLHNLKITFLTLLAVTVSMTQLWSQEFRYSHRVTRVLMDSTWDKNNEPVVAGIIEFYKPEMDRMMQQVPEGLSRFSQILLPMLCWNMAGRLVKEKWISLLPTLVV